MELIMSVIIIRKYLIVISQTFARIVSPTKLW